MGPARPKFIADCMLGKLARWLRILGYDAAYERRISDDALIARARAEDRVLLTRDTRLVARRGLPPHLLVASERPADQLRQTLRAFRLKVDSGRLLSRCLLCNTDTVEVPREEARGEVPPYVFRTQRRFARCPSCRRIYWRATHVAGILDRLVEAAGEEPGPAQGPRS
jgi:uncharacterized protein with PIN domain